MYEINWKEDDLMESTIKFVLNVVEANMVDEVFNNSTYVYDVGYYDLMRFKISKVLLDAIVSDPEVYRSLLKERSNCYEQKIDRFDRTL